LGGPDASRRKKKMYAIIGVTGKVGAVVARTLLEAGLPIRAIVRDEGKGRQWADLGAEIAIANIGDTKALTKAFAGSDGVFLMTPPNYDPEPGFPDTVANAVAIKAAIETTRPGKVVFLSTVGAHVSEFNLLNNSKLTEEMLRTVSVPVGFLRAAWFMENAVWDVEAARSGVIPSYLQPLDHAIPMVATLDIGRNVAAMLQQSWDGVRVIELEGPKRYSADDIGASFAAALGHPVRMEPVPRGNWETRFRAEGMNYPLPRIRMVDGFNEGWIDFEGDGTEHCKGSTTLGEAISALLKGAPR
jgi:NAD(P)H dehydrogenase (quinone)